MLTPTDITITAVAAGISLLSGVVSYAIQRAYSQWTKKEKRQLVEETKRRITEIGFNLGGVHLSHKIDHDPVKSRIEVTDELISQIEEGIIERISSEGNLSRKSLNDDVDSSISDLTERLKNIEEKYPKDFSLDKISSINDALLAERIEQLAKKLTQVEEKQLTKWDVAIVVSIVLSGIFAIVGTTYAALDAFGILAN